MCSEDLIVLVQRKFRITFKFAAVILIVTNCLENLGLKYALDILLHVSPVPLDSFSASFLSQPCCINGDIFSSFLATVKKVVGKQFTF